MTVELNEAMVDEDVPAITVQDIEFKPIEELTHSLDEKVVGTNQWDDCDQFFEWLDKQGFADLVKIKKTVPWNTREKFWREHVENGGTLPDWVLLKYFNTVKWNKSAITRMVKAEDAAA